MSDYDLLQWNVTGSRELALAVPGGGRVPSRGQQAQCQCQSNSQHLTLRLASRTLSSVVRV